VRRSVEHTASELGCAPEGLRMVDLQSPVNGSPQTQSIGAHHAIRQEILGVFTFVAAIWIVHFLDLFMPIDQLGLIPRRLAGLVGIATMTFVHASWSHLFANSVPLFILLMLLAGSRARSWKVVALIIVCGGLLLWLFGRPARHIGASLLVFGLISFLITSGLFFERRPVPVIVALVVGFLYGLTLITGVLPRFWSESSVSWDGHLCGAVAGALVAYGLTRPWLRPVT
jgi:membrane associated rhomboid family serine protease